MVPPAAAQQQPAADPGRRVAQHAPGRLDALGQRRRSIAHRARAGDRARSAGAARQGIPARAADVRRDAGAATDVDRLAATARRSDLSGAIADLAERHRHERLAGVVVLSDGGDTAAHEAARAEPSTRRCSPSASATPIAPRDREVVNLTAGEPLLPGASIDVSVSATSSGFGTEPVELRVSANGRPIEVRRVTPSADGAPVHEVFTVSPEPTCRRCTPWRFPRRPGEVAAENNSRSVLVPPQTGKRRLLVVEGAPGFEHTFLKRALSDDPGLEVDAVVRKGQNDDGRDTFFVQADPSRMAALSSGYPFKRSELFAYDGVIFGNIEADFFTREQLELTQRVRRRARRRPAGARRAIVRSPGAGRHGARAGAADRSHRSRIDASPSPSAQVPAVEPNTPALTVDGAIASGDAAGGDARGEPAEVGAAAGAGVGRAGRRSAARRAGAGGRPDRRRHAAAADRGAALRPGALDGVCRRSVVALAHDAAGRPTRATRRSGGSWRAGSPPARRVRSRLARSARRWPA